jgi:hypothetical protein
MCGISGGMSTTLSNWEIDHIRNLMLMSSFRGMDGSGAFIVRPNNKKLRIDIVKSELCAAELAYDPDFEDSLKSPKIVVAHARAPTRGSNDLAFVHPHRVKHITGVHNGTMYEVMDQKIDDKTSDSLAIFEAIADHGVEAFIKGSRGAYSLVWTDLLDGTLNFLRNDQRPMVFARIGSSDHASTMYFASERGMLEYVLSKRGNISDSSIKYVSPKPWEHVKFELGCKSGLFPKSLKQYDDPHKTTYTSAYSHWGAKEWEEYLEDATGKTETKTEKGTSVIPLPGPQTSTTTSTTYLPPRGTGERFIDRFRERQAQNNDPRTLPKVEQLLARRNAPSAHFRDDNLNLRLIQSGSCVICDTRPAVQGVKIPKVYPIKFGDLGSAQYICDACVQAKNPLALSVLGASFQRSRELH